ncbi:unnamed protein product, partial [Prorocentrum cordatum]
MVNILAAQQQWKLCGADISSALLQGITFEEVSKLLNEAIRDICFELPMGSAELLRPAEGLEVSDCILEVLHMEKGGVGLNDAQRLVGLRRDQVLLSIVLRVTRADPQLWLKHEDRVMAMVASTHLDDLKYAGRDKATSELVQDMSIVVDLTECVKNPSCIDEKELQGMADDAGPPGRHAKLYSSLLGAVAWCIMTRVDICIYVAALERRGKSPRVGHIKKVNILLRRMTGNPLVLVSRKLSLPVQ